MLAEVGVIDDDLVADRGQAAPRRPNRLQEQMALASDGHSRTDVTIEKETQW